MRDRFVEAAITARLAAIGWLGTVVQMVQMQFRYSKMGVQCMAERSARKPRVCLWGTSRQVGTNLNAIPRGRLFVQMLSRPPCCNARQRAMDLPPMGIHEDCGLCWACSETQSHNDPRYTVMKFCPSEFSWTQLQKYSTPF
jgi:hypothetical protein